MRESYWGRYWRRRRSRRSFLIGGAALAAGSAGLVAVGCGDDDDDDAPSEPQEPAAEETEAAATEAPAATEAAAPADGPMPGGTFRQSKTQVDDGIDPGLKVINNNEILARIYNHTHLYKVSTNEFLFDAATAMEQPDNTTIVFPLRPGMTFHHDGSAVTAEDVSSTWSRFPALLADQGSQVNEANWGFMDTITAVDESTARVDLKAPAASAPVLMAATSYGIVSKALLDQQANGNVQELDAGAGPYVIEQRDSAGVALARYPDYYAHENPSTHFLEGAPYIDRHETRIIVDRAAVKAAFFAGDIDYIPAIADSIEFEEFTGDDRFVAKEVASTEARFLAYDNIKFVDKRARQAVSYAIDYDAMIATLYAGDGVYDGPVGQALPGFALDQETLQSYRVFDPQRARELWEASGIEVDHIRIESSIDPRGSTMAEFLARQMEENLGVTAEPLIHDVTTYVARAREPIKQWELFVVPYNASTTPEIYNMTMMNPDAFAGVSWSFGTDQPDASLVANAQKLIDLTAAQAQEVDPDLRLQKMEEMQLFALDELVPGINLPVPGHSWVVYNSRLGSFPEDDVLLGGLLNRTHDMYIKG
ncbi:MAG: ABC transporter substrate-binding protein [Chloroflexota bacterium]|nr:ABC transporter substrate-binding protein [Chloroflexota bacterium]